MSEAAQTTLGNIEKEYIVQYYAMATPINRNAYKQSDNEEMKCKEQRRSQE